jgi:phospholipid-binding lipoprotein MlaA
LKFYKRQERRRWLTVVVVFLVVGFSHPTSAQSTADPIQPFNRAIYNFNDGVDKILIRPLAVGYRKFIPARLRSGVNNFFNNLRAPTTLINDVLQGKPSRAKETVDRFLINSTLGVLGLVDVASKLGFPDHEEDYGQTLAVWGVPSGPYIVLPLLGPSTIRDAVGKVPEFAIADPLWDPDDISVTVARFAVRAVDIRSRLLDIDRILKMQVDPYLFMRELYFQNRIAQISDGAISKKPADVSPIEQEILEN